MKTNLTTSLVYTLLLLCSLQPCAAQAPPQSVADSLQSILDHALNNGFSHPGVIMTVSAPGAWTWSGASGDAISGQTSGQNYAAANPTMKFRAGSITKNMMAACILKLEQQGLLNINDPINKYLRSTLITDTINPSDTVRIRHLLNHTSGIDNSASNTTCQLNVLNNPLGSHTLEEAVYCGAGQGELFPPGFAWAYSNTNYTLLAMIIESVTGQSYSSYLTQNIIQPLNLSNTEIPAGNQVNGAHMGCYWNLGSNPWTDLTIIHPSTYAGWADVVSTKQDLITYYTALRNGTIINSTELAIMNTIDPASYDYGMGLDFYTIAGQSYVGHYGEVANTSGMFFANINSPVAPNGYYITYNFNTQGSAMQSLIDVPVMQLLMNPLTSVKEEHSPAFTLYPNPAKDVLNLNFKPATFSEFRLSDLQGRVLLTKSIDKFSTSLQADLSAFEKGVYIAELRAGDQVSAVKFIRE